MRGGFCVRGYYRVYDGMSLLKHALHNTVPDIKKSIGKDENGHDIKVPDSEAIQLANTKIDEIRNGFSDSGLMLSLRSLRTDWLTFTILSSTVTSVHITMERIRHSLTSI